MVEIAHDRMLRRANLGYPLAVIWPSARCCRLQDMYNVASLPNGLIRHITTAWGHCLDIMVPLGSRLLFDGSMRHARIPIKPVLQP